MLDGLLARSGVDGAVVEDLSIGCALPVKEQWSFGGRYPLWLAERLGAHGQGCATRQLDQQCGSGLAALRNTAREIQAGAVEVGMAGGVENMTRVPMGPALFKEGVLTSPQALQKADWLALDVVLNMGLTAERLAKSAGISREAMDALALSSHQRAAKANAAGHFDAERLTLNNAAGEPVSADSNIRADTSAERLAGLDPVFMQGGVVTAGNSSPLTSGAAATLLMSESALRQHGISPLARVVAIADCGVKPEEMGAGAAAAIRRALKQAQLTPQDIGVWEINEAFAAVPLHAMGELSIAPENVNIWGGAMALGHPLGATGIRLAGTLSRVLQARQQRYGCAAACIGGGQGITIILERC